ncbi:hypothetical protein HYALB_00006774 [Hymenoscyphus albidus]|uniref:Prion-inhibition and propagation HeLo domain-containing protein n=1 Tax=Hymenoscyphus albidus TaxID=595503 RepID=A0A9N9M1N4_9HELO|nr:hypothetical protein HYALB_00006774 [Hymenoscyphus albidus]
MASGLDVAAAGVGFVSLGVMLLQGCVQGFVLLSTAQNFGTDADLVRCEIEFEQYRLFRWAEKVGLNGPSPNRYLNWQVITDHLRNLETLMTSTANIKERYGLDLVLTDEFITPNNSELPKKGWWRILASVKSDALSDTPRKLQKDTRIWKRLRWAAIDKEGMAFLLNDIRSLVDNLHELLETEDRKFMRSGMEAILRHVVSQTTDSSELAIIEQLLSPRYGVRSKLEDSAIKTAASIKQKRLMLGFGEETSPDTASASSSTTTLVPDSGSSFTQSNSRRPSPGARRSNAGMGISARGPLSYNLLRREMSMDSQTREVAIYDGKTVLVEWKTVERGLESKLKHRVKSLAALLQVIDCKTFHSLRCLGYLKDSNSGAYGYIFQPPFENSNAFMSLHQVLNIDMLPSLNERLTLAIVLTETVLQLHTSGWLHKGIRSDNILLFPKDSVIDLTHSFLEGYEYARTDNPSELTEFAELQQEADLYRHRDLLKPDRSSFRKAFDLYALGCVLVEVGLWQNLTTILLHFLRNEKMNGGSFPCRPPVQRLDYANKYEMAEVNKSNSRLLKETGVGSILAALEFAAGRRYAEAVSLCLKAGDRAKSSKGLDSDDGLDEFEDDDRCLSIEIDVLDMLKSCKI